VPALARDHRVETAIPEGKLLCARVDAQRHPLRVLQHLRLSLPVGRDTVAFTRPLTRVAAEIGLRHEAYYRCLASLTERGAIERNGRSIRVLLGTGSASFTGATTAPGKQLNPAITYYVRPVAGGRLALVDQSGHSVGVFGAPLTVSGNRPLYAAGLGSYRGALQFLPSGGGVETGEGEFGYCSDARPFR